LLTSSSHLSRAGAAEGERRSPLKSGLFHFVMWTRIVHHDNCAQAATARLPSRERPTFLQIITSGAGLLPQTLQMENGLSRGG